MLSITYAQKKKKEKYNIIKNKMEKFDIARFLKNRNNNNNYYFKNEQNQEVEQTWYDPAKFEYSETVYYNDMYGIYKRFYSNGMIKYKSQFVRNGELTIYNEHHFNERGDLIKKVDAQKKYKFKWDDVVVFCEKNNIDLKKATFNDAYSGHKGYGENLSFPVLPSVVWFIEYYGKYEDRVGFIYITLDGLTGEKILVEYTDSEPFEGGPIGYEILYKKEEPKPETKKQTPQNREKRNDIFYVENNDDSNNGGIWLLIFCIIILTIIVLYFRLKETALFD